jgi:hypothetical protein
VVKTARLFRSMKRAADDLPEVGQSGRTLGVREIDIEVDSSGWLEPEKGGMSVAPGSPANLPKHRRPPEYGGTGPDPVWRIESDDLGDDLVFRPDPGDPNGHGFLEPKTAMYLEEYERALEATRAKWQETSV